MRIFIAPNGRKYKVLNEQEEKEVKTRAREFLQEFERITEKYKCSLSENYGDGIQYIDPFDFSLAENGVDKEYFSYATEETVANFKPYISPMIEYSAEELRESDNGNENVSLQISSFDLDDAKESR